MTFGDRREAVKYFEDSRGEIFRNLSYAGIAASWTLRQETPALSAFLIAAIAMFSFYLASDACYVHLMALKERDQYLKLEAGHKKEHRNELPADEVDASYDRREVVNAERFSKWKVVPLGLACICLLLGAAGILAKHWGWIPGSSSSAMKCHSKTFPQIITDSQIYHLS